MGDARSKVSRKAIGKARYLGVGLLEHHDPRLVGALRCGKAELSTPLIPWKKIIHKHLFFLHDTAGPQSGKDQHGIDMWWETRHNAGG